MAINTQYYINAASFETATSVYLDSSLQYIAPDGFYKIGNTVRQQLAGVLRTIQYCGVCGEACGTDVGNILGTKGIYNINYRLNSDTGAVIIYFDLREIVQGIRVVYDGVTYNKISSPFYGLLQSSTSGDYTVTGISANDCGLSGNTTTYSYTNYVYNGTSYVTSGPPVSQTLIPGDIQLTATGAGICAMVIPKPSSDPKDLLVQIIAPCNEFACDPLIVSCPALLPSFASSSRLASFPAPILCSIPFNQTYYYVKVNTTNPTEPISKDYVFTDANGEFPLPDGYYVTNYDGVNNITVIEVSNGIVLARHYTNCI